MADVNLPQLNQLAQMEFMSPMMFDQAQKQIDLGNQFAQQNLAQGEQDLQAKTLANMFQVQNDPLKLQRSQQEIEKGGYENILSKINAEQRQALAPEELEAKRAKMVKEWSDSKLEKAMNDAQLMMWSDDPKIAEKGKSLYANSFKEISARMKHKDTMEQTREELASRERVAAGNNAATLGAARISADARAEAARLKAQGGGAASIWNAIQSGKMTPEKAAISAYAMAQIEQDPEEADRLLRIASTAEKMVINKAQASVDARAAGQPDIASATKGRIQPQGRQLTPAVPPPPVRPNLPSSGGNPPPMSGIPEGPQTEARRAAIDLSAVEEEYARTTDPRKRAILADQIRKERAYAKQVGAPNAPTATGARVPVIGPNGEKGSIPADQLEQALKMGYKKR